MRGPGAARVCVFRGPSVVRALGLYVLEHLMDFTFVGPTKTVVGSAPRVQCNRYRSGRVFERGVLRPGLRYHHGVETHSLHASAQALRVWPQVPAVCMGHTGRNPGFWSRAPSVPALPRARNRLRAFWGARCASTCVACVRQSLGRPPAKRCGSWTAAVRNASLLHYGVPS